MKEFGVDISKWQKGIDIGKLKADGVQFVILRGADRYTKDSEFNAFYDKCNLLGIPVGCYQYCRALSVDEAVKEARFLIDNVLKGKKFAYPIYGDFEEPSQKKLGKAKMDEIIKAYCSALEQAGYFAGVYCNEDFYKNYCSGAELSKKYTWWLAKWTSTQITAFPMWQFGGEQNFIRYNTIAGHVVDQNYCFKDFPLEIRKKKKNGFTELDENREKVKQKFGLSEDTMKYLDAYKFSESLYLKLAR